MDNKDEIAEFLEDRGRDEETEYEEYEADKIARELDIDIGQTELDLCELSDEGWVIETERGYFFNFRKRKAIEISQIEGEEATAKKRRDGLTARVFDMIYQESSWGEGEPLSIEEILSQIMEEDQHSWAAYREWANSDFPEWLGHGMPTRTEIEQAAEALEKGKVISKEGASFRLSAGMEEEINKALGEATGFSGSGPAARNIRPVEEALQRVSESEG